MSEFSEDLRRLENQLEAVMRAPPLDRRDTFLWNLEGLLGVPLSFDVAVNAAVWSVMQDDERAA